MKKEENGKSRKKRFVFHTNKTGIEIFQIMKQIKPSQRKNPFELWLADQKLNVIIKGAKRVKTDTITYAFAVFDYLTHSQQGYKKRGRQYALPKR